jgi:hypothetical protein
MSDKKNYAPDKIKHLNFGNTNYIINSYFNEKGKTVEDAIEELIINKAKEKVS